MKNQVLAYLTDGKLKFPVGLYFITALHPWKITALHPWKKKKINQPILRKT